MPHDVVWSRQLGGSSSSQLVVWIAALTLALVAHGTAAWWLTRQPPVLATQGGEPTAIMIDLAPIAMAPAAPDDQIAPDEVDSTAAAEAPLAPEQVEPLEAVESELAEPVIPDIQIEEATDTAEAVEPDPLEEMVAAELDRVIVPIPTARPEPPPQSKPQQPQPQQTRQARPPQATPSQQQTRAQAQTQQEAPRPAAPQASSGASSVSPARWQSRLMAHLERRKRYPAAARRQRQEGTAQVRFTIDQGGNVRSVSLVASSGFAALDDEVVSMVRRASPVPAPPPGVSHTIVAPVRFSLR